MVEQGHNARGVAPGVVAVEVLLHLQGKIVVVTGSSSGGSIENGGGQSVDGFLVREPFQGVFVLYQCLRNGEALTGPPGWSPSGGVAFEDEAAFGAGQDAGAPALSGILFRPVGMGSGLIRPSAGHGYDIIIN
jgi:hypothetical protein